MKLDYLSFTLKIDSGAVRNTSELFWLTIAGIRELAGPEWSDFIEDGQGFVPEMGRAPYRFSNRRADGGVHFFGSPAREEILVEMTGRACDGLQTLAQVGDFLLPLVDAITRLDLAVDYETDVTPTAFVAAGFSQRFKSSSTMHSASGSTEYVGSMKSDLMARVYRYNEPHPRSHLLRMEAVFRRQRAKDCAKWLVEAISDEFVEAALNETFGWQHALTKASGVAGSTIPTTRLDRSAQGRVHWLYSQVAPSIADAIFTNALEWDEFRDHIEALIEQKWAAAQQR